MAKDSIIIKSPTGNGEHIVYTVSEASQRRLNVHIARVRRNEANKPYRVPKMLNTDEEYEQERADRENNLIEEK